MLLLICKIYQIKLVLIIDRSRTAFVWWPHLETAAFPSKTKVGISFAFMRIFVAVLICAG